MLSRFLRLSLHYNSHLTFVHMSGRPGEQISSCQKDTIHFAIAESWGASLIFVLSLAQILLSCTCKDIQ